MPPSVSSNIYQKTTAYILGNFWLTSLHLASAQAVQPLSKSLNNTMQKSLLSELTTPPESSFDNNIITAPEIEALALNLESQQLYDTMLAFFHLEESNFADFAKNLQMAKESKDSTFVFQVFVASLKLKRYSDTLTLITQLRKLDKKNDQNDELLFATLLLNNRIEDAYQILLSQHKKAGEDKSAVISVSLQRLGLIWDNPSAIAFLTRVQKSALMDDPIFRERYDHAFIYFLIMQNRLAEAEKEINNRLLKTPKQAQLLSMKAELYASTEQRNLMNQVWQTALKDYPNDKDILHHAAKFYYQRNDFTEVISLLKNQVNHKQLSPENQNILALSYAQTNKLSEMLNVYDLKRQSSAKNDAFYFAMAKALLFSEDPQVSDATRHFSVLQLLEKIDKNSEVQFDVTWLRITVGYLQSEKMGDIAFEEFVQAVINEREATTVSEQKTIRESLLSEQLIALTAAKKHQKAFNLLSAELLKTPKNIELRYGRALLADKLNYLDLGLEDLEIAYMINQSTSASNALGYTLLLHEGASKRAETLIYAAFTEEPLSAAIIDSLGWLHYLQQNYAQAVIYLHAAYFNDASAETASHYVSALTKAGDIETAKRIFKAHEHAMRRDNYLPKQEILELLQVTIQES